MGIRLSRLLSQGLAVAVLIGAGFGFSWALNQWKLPATAESSEAATSAAEDEQGTTPHALHFMALGDAGAGTPAQKAVAALMLNRFRQQPYPLVLMLGDNIYPKGDVDKQGDALFTRIYQPLLERGVSFQPVLGNHDVLHHNGERMVRFFGMPGHYYTFRRGPVDFFAIDTNKFDGKQQTWLLQQLQNSKAAWQVVYGHHPIISSGQHGDTHQLKQALLPMLRRYGADVYLAGHDHNYERFAPWPGITTGADPVLQIVSGGGGAYLRNFNDPHALSAKRAKVHHALALEATADWLRIEALTPDGSQLSGARQVDCVVLSRVSKEPGNEEGCEIQVWPTSPEENSTAPSSL